MITGSFDDWVYDHLGVFAWTIEIWSPQRAAGIADYKFIEWYREHPVEDDLKLLAWNDTTLGGRGFVDWYPFHHPQLGDVELGGWDALYTWSNPPHALLEEELARFPKWLVWHLLVSPKLELVEASATPLGAGHLARAARGAEHGLAAELRHQARAEEQDRARARRGDRAAGRCAARDGQLRGKSADSSKAAPTSRSCRAAGPAGAATRRRTASRWNGWCVREPARR